MKGILPIIWLIAIVIMAIVTFFVAPAVGGVFAPQAPASNPQTTTNPTVGPTLPPAQPAEPSLIVVDSLKFCQTLTDGACATHSTSFTSPSRVFVTLTYSQAKVGEVLAFRWFKAGSAISGDGQEITDASGSLTTSLGQTTEGMALSAGSYTFKILDAEGNPVTDSNGMELAYNLQVA